MFKVYETFGVGDNDGFLGYGFKITESFVITTHNVIQNSHKANMCTIRFVTND